MTNVDYLDLSDILALAERLGPGVNVRDAGLLASALARPQATVFGEDAYPDAHTKAAALMHSVVTSRPYVDGNKRVGLAAALLFLGLNGHHAPTHPGLLDLTMAVAEGRVSDVAAIAAELERFTP